MSGEQPPFPTLPSGKIAMPIEQTGSLMFSNLLFPSARGSIPTHSHMHWRLGLCVLAYDTWALKWKGFQTCPGDKIDLN